MSFTWPEFRDGVAEKRFLLPVHTFVYAVQFVSTHPSPDRAQAAVGLVTSSVVESIQGHDMCSMTSLRLSEPEFGPSEDNEAILLSLSHGAPPCDFGVGLSTGRFVLMKKTSSIEELVQTVPVMEDICSRLFPPPPNGEGDEGVLSLLDVMGIRKRIHRVIFRFKQSLRVGTHITQQNKEAANTELLLKLAKMTLPAGAVSPNAEHDAPLAALKPETLLRGDVTFSFLKTINGMPRNVWITLKAPHNYTQKDVELEFDFRAGETGEIQPQDLLDWKTPFVDCYRDLFLNRFMSNLLYDVTVEPRIWGG